NRLRENLGAYSAAGDRAAEAPGRSFFDSIEDFLPYDRNDRRGPEVPQDGALMDTPLAVDVIVWPSESFQMAQRRVADVRAVIDASDTSTVLTVDDRPRFTVVRAR